MSAQWSVVTRHIDRDYCDHVECAELRRVVRAAHLIHRYDLVNSAERELGRCPNRRENR